MIRFKNGQFRYIVNMAHRVKTLLCTPKQNGLYVAKENQQSNSVTIEKCATFFSWADDICIDFPCEKYAKRFFSHSPISNFIDTTSNLHFQHHICNVLWYINELEAKILYFFPYEIGFIADLIF